MTPFDNAFKKTLGLEGGYVNDPLDAGGETKYGISKRAHPDIDIKNLTIEQAKEIYREKYWNPLKLDEVQNPLISEEIFDTAVNMGKGAAARIAQQALNFLGEGLTEDGVIGTYTINAINRWAKKDEAALFICLNGFQFIRYAHIIQKMPDKIRFSRGWTKRIQQYRGA